MSEEIDVSAIVKLHRDSIVSWKQSGVNLHAEGFSKIVEENHAYNYQLWEAEDRARRDDLGFEFVYQAKRAIDGYNQQRNDRMEAMDIHLASSLKPRSVSECFVHSETPGMMIDRLSILALKAYHMAHQVQRQDVDKLHHEKCLVKLQVIERQLTQLQNCLDQLLQEVSVGTRTFCVYYQLKMYNDKTLNPELY